MNTRICSKCGLEKQLSEFYRTRDGKYLASCKACVRKAAAKRREENPQYQKEYYQNNKEKIFALVKRWASEHPDKAREFHVKSTKKWSRSHPEKLKEYGVRGQRKWRENHPELAKLYQHLKRAVGSFEPEDIRKQLRSQRGLCWWCGKPFVETDQRLKQSIDHRISVTRGGTNNPANLVIAHLSCNQSKGNKMPWEWMGRLL